MIIEHEGEQTRSLAEKLEEVQSDCACPICQKRWAENLPKVTALMLKDRSGVVRLWCAECRDNPSLQPHGETKPEKEKPDLWSPLCPELYRLESERGRTGRERLLNAQGIRVADNRKLSAGEIVALADGRNPVILAGDPGTMKTRLAWRMIRRVFDRNGTVLCFSSWRFQSSLQDAAGKHESTKWMDELVTTDLVFIDDLGKAEWTANTHGAFFEVLDARVSNGKPMVITTNATFAEMKAAREQHKSATAQSTAGGIIRRFRDYAVVIVMQKEQ